jgi:hypothetical protein
MIRDALFASVIVLGAAGAAQAQAPDAAGRAPGGGGIVGGGLSGMLVGSGDNAQVVYSQPGAGGGGMHLVQTGRTARFAGSDDGSPRFEYGPPAAADAGREAWVTGGGGDAQVAYGRRAR